ncbi:Eco57I restriction-modification methylase domain-containing protein [Microbacterium bovistercoris]|uniref:Eco57I restriction-modification methylase domain-containing protein n=1 Tax=Microbacterium bovistercoris TaxID=2293570 RepID=UPI001FE9001D|nr:N-6 DNA methylase [Microbacterium bovistercoris]
MTTVHQADTPALRKARGAFFTPPAITAFIAAWAIRSEKDAVLEPSAGDAEFMISAVERLRALQGKDDAPPRVHGVEIHEHSARVGRERVRRAGGVPKIIRNDFFAVDPRPVYDAVIGNPPYIRYQDFSGEARARSRAAAFRAGVRLTGLASSWAAFTIHSSLFLRKGGRLGLVLPAELLSVNYAAPVRRFLFNSFRSVELVLFDEQVFPDAEADVVLLLADGHGEGPTDHAFFRQTLNASTLSPAASPGTKWTPVDPAEKWTGSIVDPNAIEPLRTLRSQGAFTDLEAWGDTTLGIVTGNNRYFTMSPARAERIGLNSDELLRLSPPGSSHLRGLELTQEMLTTLGSEGKSTYLFKPSEEPSKAALNYIREGEDTGVQDAYKCRVRKTWYQVPVVKPADLLLTCMNADTPRLTTNSARAHHLNSVHGVYLREEIRDLGADLLPTASLNSVTLLNAEMVGRSYGGGILKIEPREADRWAMPHPELVASRAGALRALKPKISALLASGRLLDAVALVDQVLLCESGLVASDEIEHVRAAHADLVRRRTVRGGSGR